MRFVNSGALTSGLRVVETGLEGFGDALSSHNFHEDAKRFKAGIDALYPYLATMAKIAKVFGRFGALGYKLWEDPNYNPSAGEVAAALLGQKEPDREVPPTAHPNYDGNPSGKPSIRYGTRGDGGATIDSKTGKIVHDFHGFPHPFTRPIAPLGAGSDANTVAGISADAIVPGPRETPSELYDRIQATYPQLTNEQCVELARKVAGIHEGVWDWRRGVNVHSADLPGGTPLATFMDRQGNPSEFYDAHQGVGAPGNNTTHAAVLVGYAKDGSGIYVAEQYVGSHGIHIVEKKWNDPRGGESAAENYFAVNDPSGLPAGENNPFRREVQAQIAANRLAASHAPYRENAPERNYFDRLKAEKSDDRPSSPNFKQPSRPYSGTPDSADDLTDYNREFDDYSDRKREYNRAMAFRPVTHAASGIDPHQSAGPIVIYDHTGGATTVTTNNVHTAQ